MIGLDGDLVMNKIRIKDKAVPIIFITGYGDVENTKKKVLEQGAYIEKSLPSLKHLETLIKNAIKMQNRRTQMLKLLVVDDEIDICDFVKKFFNERDFEVFVACDGKMAVNIVEEKAPDIVLLDILMPVMNGIDALKEMRKFDKNVRVIVVTAVDDVEKIEEAKRYGVETFLTKPLLLDQLEKTILGVAEKIKAK